MLGLTLRRRLDYLDTWHYGLVVKGKPEVMVVEFDRKGLMLSDMDTFLWGKDYYEIYEFPESGRKYPLYKRSQLALDFYRKSKKKGGFPIYNLVKYNCEWFCRRCTYLDKDNWTSTDVEKFDKDFATGLKCLSIALNYSLNKNPMPDVIPSYGHICIQHIISILKSVDKENTPEDSYKTLQGHLSMINSFYQSGTMNSMMSLIGPFLDPLVGYVNDVDLHNMGSKKSQRAIQKLAKYKFADQIVSSSAKDTEKMIKDLIKYFIDGWNNGTPLKKLNFSLQIKQLFDYYQIYKKQKSKKALDEYRDLAKSIKKKIQETSNSN